MDHFAGLDVSVKETSVCIVDDTGRIVREAKVASEPEALLAVLKNPAYHFKRIGLEAGPLSQWLYSALAEAGLPVICVETRHMRAVLKAQINKTDRNDARGIAQMMRVGLYRPVHVKTLRSQKLRMLLTHRKLLQSKAIAIENDLRSTLRNFGLKVGMVGKVKFEGRIKELVENLPDLAILVEPLLIVRRVLHEQLGILHRRLLDIVRNDDVCRRLMTVPGVGPVVALTYRATVDVPTRFKNSKAVGASFGLTPSRHQSGESDRPGSISRCGDEMMRVMLYEAAQVMLTRTNKWSWLKAWATKIARHRGMKKAIVALARRLAVIMHRIWVDGTEFRWTREVVVARGPYRIKCDRRKLELHRAVE
jgi:transposase